MLLNLSNHPSSAWSPEQMNAAIEQFQRVVDMPFPNIDPHADINAIAELGEKYADDILEFYEKLDFTPPVEISPRVYKISRDKRSEKLSVHIMGEMTFVYYIVNELKRRWIDCYASTTERTVLEEADGRKTVQFKFIQFRRYC